MVFRANVLRFFELTDEQASPRWLRHRRVRTG
jgi:hypothetical protein